MQSSEGIDYKREYYQLIKDLRRINAEIQIQRCPPHFYRKCCHLCSRLDERIKKPRKGMDIQCNGCDDYDN